jgi:hypothetical protein
MATTLDGKTRRLAGEARQARIGAEHAEAALLAHKAEARQAKFLDAHNENPSPGLLAAWEPVRRRIQDLIAEEGGEWNTWLAIVHPHRVRDGEWWLACPPNVRGWVAERYGRRWGWACQAPVRFVGCTHKAALPQIERQA